jgi:hypothetical protein
MAENNINIKKNNIDDTVQSFIYKTTYLSAQEIPKKYGAKDFIIITIKVCEQNFYQQKSNINSGYLVAAVGCTLLYLSQ